jgi:hypothetical protein
LDGLGKTRFGGFFIAREKVQFSLAGNRPGRHGPVCFNESDFMRCPMPPLHIVVLPKALKD